jgi:hypothetical protein
VNIVWKRPCGQIDDDHRLGNLVDAQHIVWGNLTESEHIVWGGQPGPRQAATSAQAVYRQEPEPPPTP